MNAHSWIVFDADGTLFDFDAAEVEALHQLFVRRGLDYDDSVYERYRQINARLWADLEQGRISSLELRVRRFAELAEAVGVDHGPDELSDGYLQCLGEQHALIDGAQAVVESLARQCRLAVATNGIAQVQRQRFARSPLLPYFEAVVISEEVGFAKPATGFFEALFDTLGRPGREQVVIVGDSLSSDIAGGAGYGIDTFWFNPHGRPNPSRLRPDFEIRRLDELLAHPRLAGAGS